jgi:hypothetical protein
VGKHAEFFHVHVTVGTADGIEFSAASRCATVANSGGSGACGKGFCEEDTTLMEEEMLVGDVISQVAYDQGFDGMGYENQQYIQVPMTWYNSKRSFKSDEKECALHQSQNSTF